MKVEGVKAKETNTVYGRTSDSIQSWEFFKKADDLFTDFMTKMVNIPSTFLTPAFTFPTKMGFLKMLEVVAFLKIVFKKIDQISAILDKNEKRSSDRKKLAKMAIFNSLNKFTKESGEEKNNYIGVDNVQRDDNNTLIVHRERKH